MVIAFQVNFWMTEIKCNWVSISNRFLTCITTWGKWNVYGNKELTICYYDLFAG